MTEPGARLAAVLQRLLHRDTFETLVSSALADLQSEAHLRWLAVISSLLGPGLVWLLVLRGATSHTTAGNLSVR